MKWINKEKELIFETENTNLFSMLKREGYTPEEENKANSELEELRKKAKELGIKGCHNMKLETLLNKIAEIETV